MLRRFFLGLAGLGLALVLGACGGDSDSASDASRASSEGAGSVSAAGESREINLAQSIQSIQELKSFKFDLKLKMDFGNLAAGTSGDPLADAFAQSLLGLFSNIEASGAYVGPESFQATLKLMGEEVSVVQIGNRAWLKEDGAWVETPAKSFLGGMTPDTLFADFVPDEVLKGAKVSQERVNGVEATRYSYDKAALEKLATEMGETADLDQVDKAELSIWVSKDNIPVKLLISFAGKDESGEAVSLNMEMNITDINDSSIEIRPPA